MSAPCQIHELVREKLLGRKIDPVGFVDTLLTLAEQVGEIQCTLGDEQALRFGIPSQPPFEVEVDAARGKLRMLCARLGVLCHESGDLDVSLYGGEGLIKKELPANLANKLELLSAPSLACPGGVSLASPPVSKRWRVQFKNTPSEQEFTIQCTAR